MIMSNATLTEVQATASAEADSPLRVRETFVVGLEHGLHARPCALLIKTLRPFSAKVVVQANGETASGNSIISLMALAAGRGAKVTFTISGEDAFRAMDAVRHLFETHFEEAFKRSSPAAPRALCKL